MSRRCGWILGATLALTACTTACTTAGDGAGAGETPVWVVDATPLIAVGDRAESDSMVLASVTDARLLADGGVAVADAGANRILFFDAAGRSGPRAGRRGRGPGEFTGQLSLVDAAGDSIAVWDPSQMRWTLVDPRTGGMRTGADSVRAPTLLHAGLEVQSDLAEPPAWVLRLMSGLSAANAELRRGYLDERGYLWVSQDVDARTWLVYADSSAAVASVVLPPNLRALHFGRGTVTGIASDSTGLEQVVVHRIAMGRAPTVDRAPAPRPVIEPRIRGELMAALRNAVGAQEMNYMRRNAYTAHADSLTLTLPEGARFKVVSANERGWRGVAWFPASGFTCAMIVGQPVPAGWGEGEPHCGW